MPKQEIADAPAAKEPGDEVLQSAVLDSALDCVVGMDVRGVVTYFNPSAERAFGYGPGETIGRELVDVVVPPALRDAHRRGLARYLATGEAKILDRRIQLVAMRSDGTEFPGELTVTRVDLPGGTVFMGFVRDITERVQSEHELRSARRRVIEAADAARERVTRDIHDGAQQQFVNTLINLQLAQQKLVGKPGARAGAARDRGVRGAGGNRKSPGAGGRDPSGDPQRSGAGGRAGLAGGADADPRRRSTSRCPSFPRRSRRASTSSARRRSRTSPSTPPQARRG